MFPGSGGSRYWQFQVLVVSGSGGARYQWFLVLVLVLAIPCCDAVRY